MTVLEQSNVDLVKSYLGQLEVIENLAFVDPAFETKMRNVGWLPPDAWCAALGKLVFLETAMLHDPAAVPLVKEYFNLSAVETYENCARSPQYHVHQDPQVGHGVVWRDGQTEQGHFGIVVGLTPTGFISIEGNTSDPNHPAYKNGVLVTDPREGYIVAQHVHILPSPDPNGLHVIGFISPNRIA